MKTLFHKTLRTVGFILLLLVLECLATYENGKIIPGEVYKNIVWETVAYKVLRLPYGIKYYGSSKTANSGEGLFLVSHTICPSGQSCGSTSQYLLTVGSLDISEFTSQDPQAEILSLVEVSAETYGWSMPSTLFPFHNGSGLNNIGYILTDGRSLGKLLQVTFGNGEVLNLYPSGDKQLNWISSGDINATASVAFLLNYDSQSVVRVNLQDMSSQSFSLQTFIPRTIGGLLVYDDDHQSLYVLSDSLQGAPEWGMLELDPNNGTVYRLHFLSSFLLNNFVPLGFFKGRDGTLYIFAGSNATNDFSSVLVRLYYTSSKDFVIDSVPVPAANYSGHFFTNDFLWITTTRGQLVRININGVLSVQGIMTIVTQKHNRNRYDPGIMPNLAAPLHIRDDLVYLTCDWWGELVAVNLKTFCSDDQKCDVEKGLSPGAIAGIVLGFIFFFACLGCLSFAIYRRKKHSIDHHHHHHEEKNPLKGAYGTLD